MTHFIIGAGSIVIAMGLFCFGYVVGIQGIEKPKPKVVK